MTKSLGILICSTLMLWATIVHANDKPTPASMPASGWSFELTPYLWASAMKADVALGPLAPTVHIDASFLDILKHLNMAFAGTFEARYARWGLIADTSYFDVKVSGTGPLGFVNGQVNQQAFFGTFAGAYRIFEQGSSSADIVGGMRVWWLNTDIKITAPGPIALSIVREKSWVDPVVGLRARAYVTPNFFAQIYGDLGGGAASKSTWQVAGLLGYDYSKTTSFFAGYRYLAEDYNRDGYVFNVKLSGPVFGASFKF